jgi:acyl dehydratase
MTTTWDDIAVGAVSEGGAFAFTADSIKRFAAEFDPRPYHIDEAAGAATFYDGLSASGAHTFAAWARLFYELTRDWGAAAGARIGEMRLLRPVRPGDVLRLRMTILGKRPHPRRAGFGFVDLRHEVLNQAGEPVLVLDIASMLERRS